MGKEESVATKHKKKKGRPSLLDLHKRRLKEQQQQQQSQNQHHNSPNHNSTPRRSTRRNPQSEDDDDEDDQFMRSHGRRRGIERNSESEEVEENGEDGGGVVVMKKRKINAIVDGSKSKVEKLVSGGADSNINQGNDGKGTTPLHDKKLLVFILDRLEKKDTHGVFSEPVDPEELPDYHEVIKHPMDFSTIRKKLSGGEYSNLESFESDVFLICSNAMQYNAPDTVYFRQARSIQELAEKSFDNLRRDSDVDEEVKEPKRRGRPPTKHLKNPVGRPPFDRSGSEDASGATLATGKESALLSSYDLRKSSPLERAGSRDSGGRSHANLGNSEAYNSGWSSHLKLDRNDDFTGSHLRGVSYKHGKKPVASAENRRDTYTQFHPSTSVNSSIFSTFDAEKKMLLPVGLHAEHGYARSLARFAAGLGPAAWDIASKKIKKSLPPEVEFGPGWVGHDDVNTQNQPLQVNPCSSSQAGASDPFSPPSVSAHSALKIHDEKSTYHQEGDTSLGYQLASTIAALDFQPAAAAAISIPSSSGQSSEVSRASPGRQTHLPQSSIGATTPSLHFQLRPQVPSPTMHMRPDHLAYPQPQLSQLNMPLKMNQLNMQSQMNQLNMQPKMNQLSVQQPWMPTGFSQKYSQAANLVPRPNVDATNHKAGSSNNGNNIFLANRSTNSNNSTSLCFQTPDSTSRLHQFHPEPTSQSAPPPDLNLQFQSPASPSSSRIDSKQPDLALQL